MPTKNPKIMLLIAGDFALFYVSLFLALFIRYQGLTSYKIWEMHEIPFFFIHIFWIFIFYIGGIYETENFSSYKKLLERVLKTMAVTSILSILIFYFVPGITITPKTNLFIDIAILTLLLVFWRKFFLHIGGKTEKIKTLFFGSSKEMEDLTNRLKSKNHLSYEVSAVLKSTDGDITNLVKQRGIQLIVAAKEMLLNEEAARKFYEVLPLGVSVIDFPSFYEMLVEKIPVSIINKTWFLENVLEINKRSFEILKRFADILGAMVLAVPALILFPFIAALSKIESSDTIWVRQKRVGKNGKIFTLYKFRNMYNATELDGKARWAEEKDPRITKVGGFLRKTRLDELPQIINVLKGEMSFIGPRPERPEFVENLEKEIPHYAMRHLVKPGLSGWAQIKFPYGASVENSMEKLQYDLYYIKNRSLVLDGAIALRTLATMMRHSGR